MPALPSIVPTSDVSAGDWTTDAGGTTDLWQKIEETIAAATDTNDYVRGPAGAPGTGAIFNVTDFPADFTFITSLAVTVRYAQSGFVDDTIGLQFWMLNQFDTVITDTVEVSDITSSAFVNSPALTWTVNAIGLAQDLAAWNGSRLVVKQTYTSVGGNDLARALVSAVELSGIYNGADAVDPALRGLVRSNLRLR